MSLVPAEVGCSGVASARLVRALALFGLVVGGGRGGERPGVDASLVGRVLAQGAGTVVLCTGASGCGKSTLLRAVAREARGRGVRVVDAGSLLGRVPAGRAVVDLFRLPLGRTLGVLAGAGLGEARLWARGVGELSEGQRARLAVALAMARVGARADARTGACAGAAPLLVLDEFCSTLDRVTARCVAGTVRRWVRGRACRVVCATAHEDLAADLAPDLHLDLGNFPNAVLATESAR